MVLVLDMGNIVTRLYDFKDILRISTAGVVH